MTYYDQVAEAAEFLRAGWARWRRAWALCWARGWARWPMRWPSAVIVPYGEIPHFPQSTVEGHSGRIVAGLLGGVPVVVMQGRVHFYEGYTPQQVTFPMRVLGTLGVRAVVLTNAAGGIKEGYHVGQLVALARPHQPDGMESADGTERAALCDAQGRGTAVLRHDGGLQRSGCGRWRTRAAAEEGFALEEGVYLATPGPSFETPAEIRAFRTLGLRWWACRRCRRRLWRGTWGLRCWAFPA